MNIFRAHNFYFFPVPGYPTALNKLIYSYNDQSVLENHHCAVLFAIMNGNTENILLYSRQGGRDTDIEHFDSVDGILVDDGTADRARARKS